MNDIVKVLEQVMVWIDIDMRSGRLSRAAAYERRNIVKSALLTAQSTSATAPVDSGDRPGAEGKRKGAGASQHNANRR